MAWEIEDSAASSAAQITWASHLPSLCFGFLICKVAVMGASSAHCYEASHHFHDNTSGEFNTCLKKIAKC